jgi:hypothetical protein
VNSLEKLWYLTGQEFDFRLEKISARKDYLLPTIQFDFMRSSRVKQGEKEQDNLVMNISMKVSIKDAAGSNITIGCARSHSLQQTWSINQDSTLTFYLTLDYYTLYQLERIREGNNLSLNFNIRFQAFVVGRHFEGNDSDLKSCSIDFDESIAKSTWVEEVLPILGYKNVALVEMPVLKYPKLNKSIDLLNSAWKSYSTGDIDDLLVECRKVLHEIGNQVKKSGFETKVEETDKYGKKKKQIYPDWKRFFDSDSKGDIVKNIIEKMSGFVAPAAHEVGVLGMNHAYFALLQTFSLTHLVISHFKIIDEKD